MKKRYFLAGTIAASLVVAPLFLSCNENNKNEKEKKVVENKTGQKATGSKIAYVEIDSLMSQYQFCKDYTLLMTQKSENIKSTLQAKGSALQRAAAEFQQKVQSGGYTQEQAMQQQGKLEKQQAELQNLQMRLGNQFEKEQQKYNNEMRDSIQAFLREYNRNYGYSLIISKAGDNLLYADPALDITNDVVNGLNKRYKPNKNVLKGVVKK